MVVHFFGLLEVWGGTADVDFAAKKLYCLWLILNPKTSAGPRQTLAPVWQTADVQKRSGDGAAWLEMSLRSRLGRRVASGGWDHISLGSPLMVSLRSFAKGVEADDMKSMRNSGTSLEFFVANKNYHWASTSLPGAPPSVHARTLSLHAGGWG